MTPSAPPDQSRTQSAYSLQWNTFRIVRPDEDRATFRNRTGLSTDDLAGKTVLDAGCGMGRYLRVVGEAGSESRRHGPQPGCRGRSRPDQGIPRSFGRARRPPPAPVRRGVVRPDLLARGPRPHARPSPGFHGFDEAAEAWRANRDLGLPPRAPALERIINVHRAISRRLPLKVLVPFSRLMAPVGGIKRKLMASRSRLVSKLGVALNLMTIGVSMHPDPEVRVCDTLDWYAPRYLTRHTPEEVRGWFEEAGLVDVVDLSKDQNYFHAGQGNGVNFAGRRNPGGMLTSS